MYLTSISKTIRKYKYLENKMAFKKSNNLINCLVYDITVMNMWHDENEWEKKLMNTEIQSQIDIQPDRYR